MTTRVKTEFDRRVEARFEERCEIARRASNCWNLGHETEERLRALAVDEVTGQMDGELRATLAPLLPAIEDSDPAAMSEYVQALARRYGVTVIWQNAERIVGLGATAFAEWHKRTVRVPLIDRQNLDRFGSALHEIGHIVAGDCTRQPPHFVDPAEKNWHVCLECEVQAWRIALEELAPVCALNLVHDRLRTSLATYTGRAPGTLEAFKKIQSLSGDLALRQTQHKRRLGLDYYAAKVQEWKDGADIFRDGADIFRARRGL